MSPAPLVHIFRDPVRKNAVLEISCSGTWKIFSGLRPESIDCTSPLLTGTETGRFPLPVRKDRRIYFLLRMEKESLLLAEEHLPMAGGFNFRDLGGITGADGKKIVWGRFIRADEMNRLTPEDLVYLSSIPVTTVVDFRTREEIAFSKDRLPSSVKNTFSLTIDPGRMDPDTLRKLQEAVTVDDMLLTMYSIISFKKSLFVFYSWNYGI